MKRGDRTDAAPDGAPNDSTRKREEPAPRQRHEALAAVLRRLDLVVGAILIAGLGRTVRVRC